MRNTEEVRDQVVLVGLNSPVLKKEENADEGTMEELRSGEKGASLEDLFLQLTDAEAVEA